MNNKLLGGLASRSRSAFKKPIPSSWLSWGGFIILNVVALFGAAMMAWLFDGVSQIQPGEAEKQRGIYALFIAPIAGIPSLVSAALGWKSRKQRGTLWLILGVASLVIFVAVVFAGFKGA